MTALYRTEQLRRIEQAHARNLPAGTLMARAGQAAAAWLDAMLMRPGARILVLCGPGNNGGDGFTCATGLRDLGHACVCWAPVSSMTADAQGARRAWTECGGAVLTELPREGHFDAIVDAMFGIGLARPLSGPYLEAGVWARQSGARIAALDVPSGLNADTGSWVGSVAGVVCDATLTFLGDKPGLHMGDGRDAVGALQIDRLQVDALESDGDLNGPGHFAAILRPRPQNSHKGLFGSVAVVGGSAGMLGAALLAARSALRLGAGRVYLCCLADRDVPVDLVCPELMVRSLAELPPVQAVVVGCGLGNGGAALQALHQVLALACPLVIDADALNLIAAEPAFEPKLARRGATQILTPHPLEAARLLDGRASAATRADRLQAAFELAQRLHATVVLKGAGSVIVDGCAAVPHYWVNPTGSAALASAGTGDVLAGMIGALLAQGFDATTSALGAAWLHGRAAEVHGADLGLLASEIAPLAARELGRLRHRAD